MRGRVRGIISAVTLAPGSSIDCAAWQRGWASPRRASWGPFHKGRPLATTSMRRSSATGTSRFMSASRTVRATLAPCSPDSHAMRKIKHSPGSDSSVNFSLTSISFPQTVPCVWQGTVSKLAPAHALAACAAQVRGMGNATCWVITVPHVLPLGCCRRARCLSSMPSRAFAAKAAPACESNRGTQGRVEKVASWSHARTASRCQLGPGVLAEAVRRVGVGPCPRCPNPAHHSQPDASAPAQRQRRG